MVAAILGFACFLALAIYGLSRPGMRRSGIYLPDFVILQLVAYAAGASLVLADDPSSAAETVLLMAGLALISTCAGFAIGAALLKRKYPRQYSQNILVQWSFGRGEEKSIYWGLAICLVVCAFFSFQVLRNGAVGSLITQAFQDSVSESGSLLQARKLITTGGEGYFAPGFVKQFRDNLLPILLSAIILISQRKRLNSGQVALVLVAGAMAVLAMLLAAVRSNLLLLFVVLFIARAQAQGAFGQIERVSRRRGGRRWRSSWIFLVIALAVYGVLTVMLGRIQNEGGVGVQAFDAIANLIDRAMIAVPRENISSYSFWVHLGPSYGSYWLADLRGILPGAGGIGLSNLLHQYNGGSIEGNSSLGMAVEVWLNWGWAGLLVIPAMFGLMINYLDFILSRMRSPVSFGIKCFLAIQLINIFSPFGFFLYGGVLVILLYVGLMMLRGSERVSSPVPSVSNLRVKRA